MRGRVTGWLWRSFEGITDINTVCLWSEKITALYIFSNLTYIEVHPPYKKDSLYKLY